MMDTADDVLEFTVGSVLSRTWRTMWKKPLAFMGHIFTSEIASVIMLAVVIFLRRKFVQCVEQHRIVFKRGRRQPDRGEWCPS
jgi:hypothetical protein